MPLLSISLPRSFVGQLLVKSADMPMLGILMRLFYLLPACLNPPYYLSSLAPPSIALLAWPAGHLLPPAFVSSLSRYARGPPPPWRHGFPSQEHEIFSWADFLPKITKTRFFAKDHENEGRERKGKAESGTPTGTEQNRQRTTGRSPVNACYCPISHCISLAYEHTYRPEQEEHNEWRFRPRRPTPTLAGVAKYF